MTTTTATTATGRAHAEALWARQQHANERNYRGFPLHSCSVLGHQGAQGFRRFVHLCADLEGRLLDVGCGPQPLPSYLEGCNLRLVHGIDPIPPTGGEHPFTFVRGVGERLPWPGGYFTTVLCATSLDHVVDPGAVLQEARRVLLPTGRLLVWCTLWPDAPAYDPRHPPDGMADECHVFHLGPWFLDLAARWFDLGRHFVEPPNDYLEFLPKVPK